MGKQSKLHPVNDAIKEAKGVLSLMKGEHLAMLLSGKINIEALIENELAARGLNKKGEWVGFNQK